VRFFERKKREPVVCPQCHQLLEPDALECDMCGFDMRAVQVGGTEAAAEPSASAHADSR
jgi:RNA polymerase subunit RPABC4/transcription elongation factor Spt4